MPGRLPGFLFPGSTSKLFVTSPPSQGRGRMHRTADFCVRSLGHCDFDFDDFSRRGRGRARRRSWGKGSVAHLPNSCCHSYLKVHTVQSPRCPRAKPFHAVKVNAAKSPTLSKKKSKFGGTLTRSGVRVRGLGLVWTSALTRSDQDQHQTRSQTRHRNLTRLVSRVVLTCLLRQDPPP